MLTMQILTQIGNRMYGKRVATKKRKIFKKMSLKFRNPKFNNLCEKTFIFNTEYQLFEVQS